MQNNNKNQAAFSQNYYPNQWFSNQPKYGGNRKKHDITIDNRNVIKKKTFTIFNEKKSVLSKSQAIWNLKYLEFRQKSRNLNFGFVQIGSSLNFNLKMKSLFFDVIFQNGKISQKWNENCHVA